MVKLMPLVLLAKLALFLKLRQKHSFHLLHQKLYWTLKSQLNFPVNCSILCLLLDSRMLSLRAMSHSSMVISAIFSATGSLKALKNTRNLHSHEASRGADQWFKDIWHYTWSISENMESCYDKLLCFVMFCLLFCAGSHRPTHEGGTASHGSGRPGRTTKRNRTQQSTTEHNRAQQSTTEHNRTHRTHMNTFCVFHIMHY